MIGMIIAGVAVALVVLIALFLSVSYIKCPPDMVYLISGIRKEAKVVTGTATLRIPFLERVDKIPLKLIQIDVKTKDVPTNDFINVDVDAVANVRISTNPELIRIAAKHFLNQGTMEISSNVQQILEGNMREIIGQMNLVDLVNNKKLFSEKIQENAIDDIQKLGLEIVNLNVQNCTDDNGAIVDLGIDNLSRIQKDAKIAKANAEKEVKIAEALADEQGNKARIEADTNIAAQNKALAIKKAEFKKEQDTAKAEADAAYGIQEAQQLKTVNEAKVAAEVARAEKLAELKEKEVILKERELDSLVRKQADAERYAAEVRAQAEKAVKIQQAEADAEMAKRDAEATIAIAQANKEAAILEAEGIKAKLMAEAEGIKAKGLAEAEGIKAKGLAEAKAMQEKAKASEVTVAEMFFKVLPDIAKNVSEPLNGVDNITMYGGDQVSKFIGNNLQNVDKILEVAEKGLGINVQSLLNNFLNKPKISDIKASMDDVKKETLE